MEENIDKLQAILPGSSMQCIIWNADRCISYKCVLRPWCNTADCYCKLSYLYSWHYV